METVLLIGLVIFLLLAGLLTFMVNGFRNPRRSHRQYPSHQGIAFTEIRISTENKRRLYGWWIPADPDTASAPLIVLVHGWGQNAGLWLPLIPHWHRAGFHLLAFDSRNHGYSDADGYSTMVKFAEDLLAAIHYAEAHYGNRLQWVGVMGFSIGAAAALLAAAREASIKRVVAVGAFSHPGHIMRQGFEKKRIPFFPLVWLLFKYIEWRIGARLDEIAPLNNIQKVQAELLLLHGKNDRVVPVHHSHILHQRARPRKARFVLINDCQHSNCLQATDLPELVIRFFRNGLDSITQYQIPVPENASGVRTTKA